MTQIRTIADLSGVVRARRQALGLTQAMLAARAGVSRKWLVDLEGSKASIEIGLLLRVLDALDLALQATQSAQDDSASDLDRLLETYRRG